MNIKKKLREELRKKETPSVDRVLPNSDLVNTNSETADFRNQRSIFRPRRRFGVILTAAVLTVLLAIGCGAAIPVIIERINSPRVVNALRKTEVPEGWVGVYDYEDLLIINDYENKDAKLILMNDITIPDEAYAAGGIFEGGIKPLGIYDNASFYGDVNGNGYTISNLKLVSVRGRVYGDVIFAGLFGYSSAEISHLGIEDVEVKVEIGDDVIHDKVYVGTVAAKADVIAGCYAKNVKVYFSNAADLVELGGAIFSDSGRPIVGGLCGYANYVDSCFVKNASIETDCSGTGYEIMVGGVCGTASACVTSYFEGKIITNNENYENIYVDNVCAMAYAAYSPQIIPDEGMQALKAKLEEAGMGKDTFEYKKFMSNYMDYDPSIFDGNSNYSQETIDRLNQVIMKNVNDFYSLEFEKYEGKLYIMDDSVNASDIEYATEVFIKAFDNDTHAAEKFCYEYNIKCGRLYCYSFDAGEQIARETLEGFDFENIWEETEDGIIQKIFVD